MGSWILALLAQCRTAEAEKTKFVPSNWHLPELEQNLVAKLAAKREQERLEEASRNDPAALEELRQRKIAAYWAFRGRFIQQ